MEARKVFGTWLLLDGGKGIGVDDKTEFTVKELWRVYYEKHVQRNVVGQKIVDYSWANLEPHFGALTVKQVTQDAVEAYVDKRHAGRVGRPSKDVTIRRELAYLVAALHFCAGPKAKMFPETDIESLQLPDAGKPREKWLNVEEIKKLLDTAATMRLTDGRLTKLERFLWLATQTGARKSAILELTWSRVDFEAGTIDYRDPGRKVTKKRRVKVPISASLRPVLERAWAERTTDYVLDNPSDGVWASLQIVANKAGLGGKPTAKGKAPVGTGISPHVLRHSVATLMARSGTPLWDIANTLGNTLAVTEKVYTTWNPDNPARTVDRISGETIKLVE